MSDAKELKEKYSGEKFTYIYWPVSIENFDDLHITYKFLGEADCDFNTIKDLLFKNGYPKYPLVQEWAPVEFDTKNDNLVKVLEFTKFDPKMSEMRKCLNALKQDDYPSYRPHVTVDEEVWSFIKEHNLSVKDIDFKVKPLEVKIKGKIYKVD